MFIITIYKKFQSLAFIKSKVQKRLINHKDSHSHHEKEQTECQTHRALASVIPSPISRRQRIQNLAELN